MQFSNVIRCNGTIIKNPQVDNMQRQRTQHTKTKELHSGIQSEIPWHVSDFKSYGRLINPKMPKSVIVQDFAMSTNIIVIKLILSLSSSGKQVSSCKRNRQTDKTSYPPSYFNGRYYQVWYCSDDIKRSKAYIPCLLIILMKWYHIRNVNLYMQIIEGKSIATNLQMIKLY